MFLIPSHTRLHIGRGLVSDSSLGVLQMFSTASTDVIFGTFAFLEGYAIHTQPPKEVLTQMMLDPLGRDIAPFAYTKATTDSIRNVQACGLLTVEQTNNHSVPQAQGWFGP